MAVRIKACLQQGKDDGREQHVVHLGDIYYSGLRREYQNRFRDYWPVSFDEDITLWACNGNHEMYSGGHSYFGDLLARDKRFALQEGSSFFSLENEHWQILGLDTAWDIPDLRGSKGTLREPQAKWIKEKLEIMPRRKTLLLSHHQLFTTYKGEEGSPDIEEELAKTLSETRIDAWFWGHEHCCALYKEAFHRGVRWARCIGHGGVPVYVRKGQLPEGVDYEYREPLPKEHWWNWEQWARFGFAVLDFDGPSIRVRYVDETGHEHKSEIIQ